VYHTLIIGGGPSGSYLAGQLAYLGYQTIVFEQNQNLGAKKCCTGIIGKECFDTFLAPQNLNPRVILREADSAKFFSPSGKLLRVTQEKAQAYVIDRSLFDLSLAEEAQRKGAEYFLGAQVEEVNSVNNHFEVKALGRTFAGRTLVLANGFGSKLTQKLGLDKINDLVIGAQAEVQTSGIDEVEIYLGNQIAPGFFAWLVPTTQGKALAGLLSRHHIGLYLRNFLQLLFRQGKIASPDVEISYGGIPLKPLPKTYCSAIVVVGDAAGQVKPTTGGGIYYGLIGAQAAAATLDQSLSSNDFSARLFSSYEKAWRSKIDKEIKIGSRARWLFERLSDKKVDHFFEVIQSRDIHKTLLSSADFSFDRHGGLLLKGLRQLRPKELAQLLLPF
jgi:geranylgeranyl reductase family protein